jgi:carboxyl-terminal processing protease
VDGVSTAGWSLNDAVDRITGRRGTEVELGLRREDVDEPISMSIVRDVIKIRSVKGWWKKELGPEGKPIWDWFIDPHTRIAYIRLTAFNEDTHEDLKAAWREINEVGRPNGVILDIRYNPGGLLTSAVEVSNLFVRNGVIVSGETKDGGTAWPDRRAEAHKALIANEGVPTVVLINQGSASASEIVAGCMQAHRASVVVGRRSFGKGSVQTVHPISRSSALLKLTTQYYRLPATQEQRAAGNKGDLVHKRSGAKDWGVDPDVEVNTTPQQIKAAYDLRQSADIISRDAGEAQERPDINDLITLGLDPQLETALLILQAKALETTAGDTRHASAK